MCMSNLPLLFQCIGSWTGFVFFFFFKLSSFASPYITFETVAML